MQINPMQIIQMIKGGSNPQQLIMSFLQQQNNPMANNLLQMAQNGNISGIEQIARNICAQKGLDFDKEFNSFKQQLGIK